MLYIIRHGRTDWNDMHKLQGRTDTELNEDGIRMAERAAKEYGEIHFDVCYCSPLKRAKQTAEIVAKAGFAILRLLKFQLANSILFNTAQ